MMKFGFELEAFCLSVIDDKPQLVPDGLPFDECGWLAEIRSQPDTCITKAIFLLKAEQEIVEKLAFKKGIWLLYEPLKEIPRDLKVKAARRHGKGLLTYQNVYGHETHKNPTKLATASLHVSVTNEKEYHHKKPFAAASLLLVEEKFTYPGFIDHARLIIGLDRAFAAEIKAAKRNPGFYEVKPDGRIEYRSLPNNVDLDKLSAVLRDIFR